MPTLRNNSKKKTSQGDKKPKYALWKKYETRKNIPLHAAHRQNTNMQLIKNPVWDDYKGAFKYTFGSKEDVHYYEKEIKVKKQRRVLEKSRKGLKTKLPKTTQNA